jgi:hypothetical protein
VNLHTLLEIPIVVEGTCHTSVKAVLGEVSHFEKGKWNDREQDWHPVVVMKNGVRFDVSLPIYKKLLAVEDAANQGGPGFSNFMILRRALEQIASFNEGPEVTGSFDEPASAKIAREALAAIGVRSAA